MLLLSGLPTPRITAPAKADAMSPLLVDAVWACPPTHGGGESVALLCSPSALLPTTVVPPDEGPWAGRWLEQLSRSWGGAGALGALRT